MDLTDKFFSDLTKKESSNFNSVEFFKDAPFVLAFDFSNTKLASVDLSTKSSNTAHTFGWGLNASENKLPMPKDGKPVGSFGVLGSNKITQMAPNNMSGFQGMVNPKNKGTGFNPV